MQSRDHVGSVTRTNTLSRKKRYTCEWFSCCWRRYLETAHWICLSVPLGTDPHVALCVAMALIKEWRRCCCELFTGSWIVAIKLTCCAALRLLLLYVLCARNSRRRRVVVESTSDAGHSRGRLRPCLIYCYLLFPVRWDLTRPKASSK